MNAADEIARAFAELEEDFPHKYPPDLLRQIALLAEHLSRNGAGEDSINMVSMLVKGAYIAGHGIHLSTRGEEEEDEEEELLAAIASKKGNRIRNMGEPLSKARPFKRRKTEPKKKKDDGKDDKLSDFLKEVL